VRRLPPLFSELPRPVQAFVAVILPALFGALTGYFLGESEAVYLVLSIIGIVGGIGAGFDHVGARAGALRGIVAGSLFGGFILIVYELRGEPATAELPEPAILLIALTTVLAVCFAALGGWLRQRAIRRGAKEGAPEVPGPLG
jgi:hypothetical protein